MLPKHKRISKDSFKPILLQGSLYHSTYFTLRALPSNTDSYAVLVSKKVAQNAVDRNRIRRRVYSLIREHLSDIKKPAKAVFSAKKGALTLSFEKQKEEIVGLMKKAQII